MTTPALACALGCVLCLASADFFLKLSSTRISSSVGTLVYALTAAVAAGLWVAWCAVAGEPLRMTRAGLFASMAVGVSFMLVVALLSVLFATGANLSVIVPAIRLLAIVLVAALGILALGEPVTWRYTLGASLALAGVYFIVVR